MQYNIPRKIVLLGASTGGPGQIQKILESLPILSDTAVIIAQHMVKGFLPSFAKRLQESNKNTIIMANDNDELKQGIIYICSGYTSVVNKNNGLYFSKTDAPEHAFNPNINLIFKSMLPFTNDITMLAVILTGIGNDGVDACNELSLNGTRCITETAQSAIVDGMPNSARVTIDNIEIEDIKDIIKTIKEFTS